MDKIICRIITPEEFEARRSDYIQGPASQFPAAKAAHYLKFQIQYFHDFDKPGIGNYPAGAVKLFIHNAGDFPVSDIYIHLLLDHRFDDSVHLHKYFNIDGTLLPGRNLCLPLNLQLSGNVKNRFKKQISEYCFAINHSEAKNPCIYINYQTRSIRITESRYLHQRLGIDFAGKKNLLILYPQMYNGQKILPVQIANRSEVSVSSIYLELMLTHTDSTEEIIHIQIYETLKPHTTFLHQEPQIEAYFKVRIISCMYLIHQDLRTWRLLIDGRSQKIRLESVNPETGQFNSLNGRKQISGAMKLFYRKPEKSIMEQSASNSKQLKQATVSGKAILTDYSSDKAMNMTAVQTVCSQTSQSPRIIEELQIIQDGIHVINSSHNHVTLNHPVRDEKILIQVLSRNRTEKSVLYHAHYCEKCKCHFDFGYSYESQLKLIGVPHFAVVTAVRDPLGYLWSPASDTMSLRQEHILHYYGYRTGQTRGLSDSQRHALLKQLISSRILSKGEIKDHLEFLIRYQGRRPNMNAAVQDWKNDIQFLNSEF